MHVATTAWVSAFLKAPNFYDSSCYLLSRSMSWEVNAAWLLSLVCRHYMSYAGRQALKYQLHALSGTGQIQIRQGKANARAGGSRRPSRRDAHNASLIRIRALYVLRDAPGLDSSPPSGMHGVCRAAVLTLYRMMSTTAVLCVQIGQEITPIK